jgi:hypothetical protein
MSYQLDPASGGTILHVRRQSICAIPAPRNIPINCNKTNHQCNYRTNRHYATQLTPRPTQNHYSHGYTIHTNSTDTTCWPAAFLARTQSRYQSNNRKAGKQQLQANRFRWVHAKDTWMFRLHTRKA